MENRGEVNGVAGFVDGGVVAIEGSVVDAPGFVVDTEGGVVGGVVVGTFADVAGVVDCAGVGDVALGVFAGSVGVGFVVGAAFETATDGCLETVEDGGWKLFDVFAELDEFGGCVAAETVVFEEREGVCVVNVADICAGVSVVVVVVVAVVGVGFAVELGVVVVVSDGVDAGYLVVVVEAGADAAGGLVGGAGVGFVGPCRVVVVPSTLLVDVVAVVVAGEAVVVVADNVGLEVVVVDAIVGVWVVVDEGVTADVGAIVIVFGADSGDTIGAGFDEGNVCAIGSLGAT